MDRRTLIGGGIAALGLAACAQNAPAQTTPPAPAPAPDPENALILEIPSGRVVIQMRPDLAPNTVARIKTLTRQGFYDNTPFHRVIPGFMAQGGDPTGTGTGGSRLPNLVAEFSPPSRARFVRGTVGMARTAAPNTANSQFFIMFAPNSGLDGQYTIWGQVTSGMDAVDKIKPGAPGSGTVTNPDRIRTARIAADVR
jgi:peptidylprolyl isomerase